MRKLKLSNWRSYLPGVDAAVVTSRLDRVYVLEFSRTEISSKCGREVAEVNLPTIVAGYGLKASKSAPQSD
jgi:hypothetical protein